MSCAKSVSAPSTPTEQAKQLHAKVSFKKKEKRNRVHFPIDEMLVTCYLEPPDPWSKVYCNTLNTLLTAYVAACDKQGIKPLTCVLDQLQEYENCSNKLESNPRAFDLSILGEKLSVKHCEALEEVLRRLQFHLVDLEGCYLEDEGAAAFFDMIEYYDSAVNLNISFTKHIDCRGWQACSRMLKKTTSLVHLNARSTGLNEQVLLIVGRALRLGSNLVTLHLENCGIFGRCLVILVAALKMNTTLRELFLAENKVSSADGFQLGNLLRTNTHLELLDLSNNKLGDDGLIHLMESLSQQSNTSGRGLSTLILWNNELTFKGMPCVSRAITSARALRRLNLGSNAISSAGVLELKLSFICNRTIEIVELENASITSEGAFAIAEYISQNEYLQRIDIRGNDINLKGLKVLSQAMINNFNVTSLQIDPTPMDLTESIKDRQHELQEICKFCQRNKEAKNSLPPQDAQLSTLFNGIFSHVLPTPNSTDSQQLQNVNKELGSNASQNSLKGRFRVSLVVLNNPENSNLEEVKPYQMAPRSLSLDTESSYNSSSLSSVSLAAEQKSKFLNSQLPIIPASETVTDGSSDSIVSDRIKWLEGMSISSNLDCSVCDEEVRYNLEKDSAEMTSLFNAKDEVFLPTEASEELLAKRKELRALGLTLCLNSTRGLPDAEQKVRRLSSPTFSTAPQMCRKTHSIKCCKELEGLDLRSSVPLSPTRLHESFDYPETDMNEVSLSSQMKPSHAVYMVH